MFLLERDEMMTDTAKNSVKNSTDLRILKTRRQIKEALLNLLDQQPFDTITVSQIAQQAMISRSTFYDHYPDKYALLDAMYGEVEEQFRYITEAYFTSTVHGYRLELANKILCYVMENARLFRVLLSNIIPSRNILLLLKEVLGEKCMEYLNKSPNKYNLDNEFVAQIYCSIIYLSIQWVARNQNPADLDKLIDLSTQVRKLFYD